MSGREIHRLIMAMNTMEELTHESPNISICWAFLFARQFYVAMMLIAPHYVWLLKNKKPLLKPFYKIMKKSKSTKKK